jgi:hypothetical protein
MVNCWLGGHSLARSLTVILPAGPAQDLQCPRQDLLAESSFLAARSEVS